MTSVPTSASRGETIRFLPISQLRTTYATLRSPVSPPPDDLSALPLRIVPAENHFEIIDGFKRFEAWKESGLTDIPVVIERACSVPQQKKLMLQANAQRRTISPLDEACVAASLISDDGLTATAVGRLLGRKKNWVMHRGALLYGLSEQATAWV